MLPASPEYHLVTPADLAVCRQMIRDGSKTFYTASLLLPEKVRDAARALYGFCRVADDAVDQSTDSKAAVEGLHRRLDNIYRQMPDAHPADRAFADVVWRYSLPRSLPEALIEGFAWDAQGRRYEDMSAVRAYAVRVAGTVGAMMAIIMQARDPVAIARACDLGVAMQLTNIARDVGADAAIGRIYLPETWLEEAGIDPRQWLEAPRHSPQLAGVIARLLAEAERLYSRADAGIALLPSACRPAIRAARLLYAGIGGAVARAGFDSVSRRAVVPRSEKFKLLASAVATGLLPAPRNDEPALDEAHFLVDAVGAAPHPHAGPISFDDRAAWLTALFTRLERQQS